MAPRGTRAERAAKAMREHQPGSLPNLCICGFRIKRNDTQTDHAARAVVSRLYGTLNPDTQYVSEQRHKGCPDNIALHRASGEPLCPACRNWLEKGD